MSVPRVLATVDVAAGRATLTSDEAHHLTRVLRLTAGDRVRVFDGVGGEWDARLDRVSRETATVTLLQAVTPVAEPPVAVTVASAWLKGDAMDDVVRDVTMLGAAAILPLVTQHVVGRRPGDVERLVERWRRVAVASCKQCRRAVVPRIFAPVAFETGVARPDAGTIVMCVEPEAGVSLPTPKRIEWPRADSDGRSRATLFVGPEGGWSAEEIALAARHGAIGLGLGPMTIRADAAPTVALSILLMREWVNR